MILNILGILFFIKSVDIYPFVWSIYPIFVLNKLK